MGSVLHGQTLTSSARNIRRITEQAWPVIGPSIAVNCGQFTKHRSSHTHQVTDPRTRRSINYNDRSQYDDPVAARMTSLVTGASSISKQKDGSSGSMATVELHAAPGSGPCRLAVGLVF